eukprot:Phypoly_transcript_10520.p1 GENE.Phypoly_transcript_10520~~Phypoly_transcript_10520.p1  ORF type:complete len:389 (-),score=43.88 Phypoly_transcript_10520:137-1276(-)
MRVIIVFCILIVCGYCNLPPVVYIPGSPDVALQINIVGEVQPPAGCPTTGQFIVFGNDTFQGLNNGSCFYYYLSIIYDSKTQTFSNQTNVEVSVVLPTDGDYELFPSMQKFGYEFNSTYFLAVYDWRLSPNLDHSFMARTMGLIEMAYANNGNQKVHLIGHSTGGGMTLGFLTLTTQAWKDQYIAAAITLSGNLAGEIDIFGDLTLFDSQFDGVDANFSRGLWWTQPAEAWQLPHPGIYPTTKVVVKTPSKDYSVFDVLQLLQALNAAPMDQWYANTYLYNVTGNFTFPGVDTYCLWGEGLPTLVGYEFKDDNFNSEPKILYGNGDGDQDIITNSACLRWENETLQNHTFVGKGFIGVDHGGMTSNKRVMDFLRKILQI